MRPKVFQGTKELVIQSEMDGMARWVHLDGRPLPVDPFPSWLGYSSGHWDGDTLVVDSWGFNGNTWFDQIGGYFHSENMHVIERFTRRGNTLTWTATVDDPDVLLEPWTTTRPILPVFTACSKLLSKFASQRVPS